LSKSLGHPNIVPFIGVTTNSLQIVLEWMPNGTLTEFVEKNPSASRIGLVSPSQQPDLTDIYVLKLMDVAEGLGYLHANRTTHGDLSGAGVFFWSFRPPR